MQSHSTPSDPNGATPWILCILGAIAITLTIPLLLVSIASFSSQNSFSLRYIQKRRLARKKSYDFLSRNLLNKAKRMEPHT